MRYRERKTVSIGTIFSIYLYNLTITRTKTALSTLTLCRCGLNKLTCKIPFNISITFFLI